MKTLLSILLVFTAMIAGADPGQDQCESDGIVSECGFFLFARNYIYVVDYGTHTDEGYIMLPSGSPRWISIEVDGRPDYIWIYTYEIYETELITYCTCIEDVIFDSNFEPGGLWRWSDIMVK